MGEGLSKLNELILDPPLSTQAVRLFTTLETRVALTVELLLSFKQLPYSCEVCFIQPLLAIAAKKHLQIDTHDRPTLAQLFQM